MRIMFQSVRESLINRLEANLNISFTFEKRDPISLRNPFDDRRRRAQRREKTLLAKTEGRRKRRKYDTMHKSSSADFEAL